MKQKLKSYEFWMSLASAIALVAGTLGADVPHLQEICAAIVGLLVAIGIVKKPPTAAENAVGNESETETENKSETESENATNEGQTTEN